MCPLLETCLNYPASGTEPRAPEKQVFSRLEGKSHLTYLDTDFQALDVQGDEWPLARGPARAHPSGGDFAEAPSSTGNNCRS